ncbi:MAG: glycoside hydrolase family 97 catalytic domain-containing protein [Terracidiphilus sp.]
MRCLVVAFLGAALSISVAGQDKPLHLSSPDQHLAVSVWLQDGVPMYSAMFNGKPELLSSRLGLDSGDLSPLAIASEHRDSHDSSWRPAYGERDLITDHYNELDLTLAQSGAPLLRLVLRAYNEGLAFRYVALHPMNVAAEKTTFRWASGTFAYEEHGGTEGVYARAAIGEIAPKCQTPLTLELPDGNYAAILEAGNADFPYMMAGTLAGSHDTIEAELSGTATLAANAASPWRAVMFATSPAQLLEHNYLQLNLNAPQALEDVSWIHPGAAMRETSLSTAGAKKLIDFAVQHGIPYIGFDDGWYGSEDIERGDATHERTHDKNGKPTPPLSIAEVAAYGKQHGIGLFIYIDRRQAFKQRDILFPLYKSWGVAGVKIGFVDVGTQQDTAWITETVRKAAEYHLMLDIHDQYRGTGYTRTYPNLLTVEGVRGNEHMPTSEHNATLPFTRFLAGAADVTICYMDKRLVNTKAHQMAMSVIVYSPLQWLFWYDTPAEFHDEPELAWFSHLPTVWNETRVPGGEIGKFAIVARRSGEQWYVGAITNSDPRRLPLKLDFLKSRTTYDATIYRDDPAVSTATHVAIDHRTVRRGDSIDLTLLANGGETVLLKPAMK